MISPRVLLSGESWTTTGPITHTVTQGRNNDLLVSSLQIDTEAAILIVCDDEGLLGRAGALDLIPDPDTGLPRTTTLTKGGRGRWYFSHFPSWFSHRPRDKCGGVGCQRSMTSASRPAYEPAIIVPKRRTPTGRSGEFDELQEALAA